MDAPSSAFSSLEEMLNIAKTFVCPAHPEREDSTFGCDECMDSKPDSWEFKKTNSNHRAIEIVYELFRKAFCTKHSDTEASHYCLKEHAGKCPDCKVKCCKAKHKIEDIDTLYKSKLNNLIHVDESVLGLRTNQLPAIDQVVEEFKQKEIDRINKEFNEYIAMIERKREETLAELPQRVEMYLRSQKCLRLDDIQVWNSTMEEAKVMNKVDLILASIKGGLHSQVETFEKTEENYQNLVCDHYFHTKTMFLRSNLIDISEIPLLAKNPTTEYGSWKLPRKGAFISDRSVEEIEEVEEEEEETKIERPRPKQISKGKTCGATKRVVGGYEEFRKICMELHRQFVTDTLPLDEAKRQVRALCEDYQHIIKTWKAEGYYMRLYEKSKIW
eukprot:CAMPEP_0115010080 /NCGR_PEP_ID=MMETSP0216-20121206/23066_1 /TAXON_ID=223996 /ORGANISM="Protocruzia adherens, Strain Boccale" /LENGTH=385 /DNA_ID=CAMNT_0002378153 /DNA_START=83 /DNA_END=1237 /DNA_ORIENTATION=-